MSKDKKTLFNIISDFINTSLNPSSAITDLGYIISRVYLKNIEKKILEIDTAKRLLEERLSQISENEIIPPNIQITDQEFFNQLNITYPNLLDNNKEKIMKYIEIYQSFDMKSISDVTTNKCIVDSLGHPISDISKIKIDVSEVNDELLKTLKRNPNYFYKLSSRKFEQVVAEILSRKGYDVKLTAPSRDGGKDIYVAHDTDFGTFLYVVECKKYSPPNKVGVGILRDLYGVVSKENLNAGIIATTSYFTKPAQEFQQDLKTKIKLKDFDSIKQWLYEID